MAARGHRRGSHPRLTFTNTGTQDVTLDLTLSADASTFTLGAPTVTVPAGGTASVPVTGDPQTAEIGRHTGYVVGTNALNGVPVTRTSVALLKEDERYDLDIKLVDRQGAPAAAWVTVNSPVTAAGASSSTARRCSAWPRAATRWRRTWT